MNETSSFKKGRHEPLINIEEQIKQSNDFPLDKDDRNEREDVLIFEVFDPNFKSDINTANDQKNNQYNVMYFNKKKKKSNKD